MSTLIPFDFQNSEVRIITENEEPLFVAKDICNILGITTEQTRRLDEDEKGLRQVQTPGGLQEMVVLTIDGVYELIFRSDKPKAKEFRKWLKKEVLPSLAKNGSYSLGQQSQPSTKELNKSGQQSLFDIDGVVEPLIQSSTLIVTNRNKPGEYLRKNIKDIAATSKGCKGLLKDLNILKGNQFALSLNRLIKEAHNIDILELSGNTHLIAENQTGHHFAVSDLSKPLNLSPQKLNQLLKDQGFQDEKRDHKNKIVWEATAKAEGHYLYADTGKKHSNGTPVTTLRWFRTIIDALDLSEVK